MAAAMDAGNRSMKLGHRPIWNEEDWDAAVLVFDSLYDELRTFKNENPQIIHFTYIDDDNNEYLWSGYEIFEKNFVADP